VREYTEHYYLPAAAAYRSRAAGDCAIGRQIVEWQHDLDQKWAALHFSKIKSETRNNHHLFELQLYLHNLDPKTVRVELYADGVINNPSLCQEMTLIRQLVGASDGYVYSTAVPASRPATDYTARVIPYFDGLAIPLEEGRILWQQ
ncbi:MAG: DUF3417 domain-containing protein, partial [Methylococcaceae bacterium]